MTTLLLELIGLAIAAAFYPTLITIVILSLGRPAPVRLLAYFLAGAALTGLTIGIAVALFLGDRINLGRRSVNGTVYVVAGTLAILAGVALLRKRKRPQSAPKPKQESRWSQRMRSGLGPKVAFVLGVVLDLPGIWYLIALKNIAISGYSDTVKVLLVVAFNVLMFAFVELPLVGFLVAPESTRARVDAFQAWLRRNGRRLGAYVALAFGTYLVVRGVFVLT